MKFRTDFVTNSSSSSFMVDWRINYKDLSSESVLDNDECRTSPSIYRRDDDIYFHDFKIKTFEELLACLYLYQADEAIDGYLVPVLVSASLYLAGKKPISELDDDLSNIPDIDVSLIPVLTSVFQFLADKKPFTEIIDDIRAVISESSEEPEWTDKTEIEELLDIDPDDYDNDELIETVLELFGDFLGTDAFKNLENVKENICNHQDKSLSEVNSLSFSERESNYGEFVNPGIEYLYKRFGEDEPKETSKDDPLYEKERSKWKFFVNFYLLNDFYTSGSRPDSVVELDLNIDKGLQSGEFRFMIESVIREHTAYIKFLEDEPQTLEFSKDQRSIVEEDNAHPDSHIDERGLFYLLACELDQYGPNSYENKFYSESPKHDSLKLLIQNGDIPKIFTQYPITDLLEKAMKHNANEYLDLLLSTGLELDYADVAHYIYNDTMETLYPLFDRGLKIDSSAYDDLITYASEHGKPEYTAWLLIRKNEYQPSKDANK